MKHVPNLANQEPMLPAITTFRKRPQLTAMNPLIDHLLINPERERHIPHAPNQFTINMLDHRKPRLDWMSAAANVPFLTNATLEIAGSARPNKILDLV